MTARDSASRRPRLRRAIRVAGRCLRLRCPRCGRGRMFVRRFTLHDGCADCGLSFEPEQGYYVGAIYLNYAATVLIATPGFLILDHWADWPLATQLAVWAGFAVGFPILAFRHTKSVWRGLDYLVTHPAADDWTDPEG